MYYEQPINAFFSTKTDQCTVFTSHYNNIYYKSDSESALDSQKEITTYIGTWFQNSHCIYKLEFDEAHCI